MWGIAVMSTGGLSAGELIVRSKECVEAELDDELVMMSIELGEFYSLGNIAREIWQMLEKPVSVEQLVGNLSSRYQVDPETCKRDVVAFISELTEHNLVEKAAARAS